CEHCVSLWTIRFQFFKGSRHQARHAVLGAEPGDALAVFQNVEYFWCFYSQSDRQLRMGHSLRPIPLQRPLRCDDPEVSASGLLDAFDVGPGYRRRENSVLESVESTVRAHP